MKAATEVVPDPAGAHARQSESDLALGIVVVLLEASPQEHVEAHGVGELGASPEAPVSLVETRGQLAARLGKKIGSQLGLTGASTFDLTDPRDRLGDLARLNLDVGSFLAVGVGNGSKNRGETGDAVTIAGREIGACKEGLLIGREKHREGPPSRTSHQLDDQLVDVIEIRPLFAVDLD
jgi:hypothetical protein